MREGWFDMRTATAIRKLLLPALALLAILALTGCGERDMSAEAPPEDLVFVIQPGDLAKHMRGEIDELVPERIELVAGQSIVIHNHDQALHYFLSEPIWPGETLVKTFDEPGTYRYDGAFTCSIGKLTTLTIHVSA